MSLRTLYSENGSERRVQFIDASRKKWPEKNRKALVRSFFQVRRPTSLYGDEMNRFARSLQMI